MRNELAHDYGAVDLETVYDVVANDLPHLLKHLADLIAELEQAVGWQDEQNG